MAVSSGQPPPEGASGPVIIAVASHAEARLLPRNATGFRVVRVGPALRSGGALADPATLEAAAGLLSFGFAGGLDPALSPGTVILPRQVRTDDDRVVGIDSQWHSQVAAELGPYGARCDAALLSVDRVHGSSAQKLALGRSGDAAAVDLESAPLALAAARTHLPFLVLRVVLDAADDELPPDADRLLTADGRARPALALLSLLRAPHRFLLLLRRHRHASARLRRAFLLSQDVLRAGAARGRAGPTGSTGSEPAQ